MNITYLLNTRFTSLLFILSTTLHLSACSTGEDPEATTPSIVDSFSQPVTYVNHPAIISGIDSGSVTEDLDADSNNLLNAGGRLTIAEIDTDEAAFIENSINGAYGSLSIIADGTWNYSADNTQIEIQNLASGTSLSDSLTVNSIDGTEHTVVITINGVDEVITPITSTDPVEPVATDSNTDPVVTDTTDTSTDPVVTDTADTNSDPVVTDAAITINLAWTAPSSREDNSPLSLSAIGGYKLYYGNAEGQYTNSVTIDDGSANSYTFSDLAGGTYYFVITTYDTDGRESQHSPVIIKTI